MRAPGWTGNPAQHASCNGHRSRGRGPRPHDDREDATMTWWEALLLGVVQGLTEFFPVSSSGHLVIGNALLGLDTPGIVFEVAVHVGTLVSVFIVYRAKIGRLLLGMVGRGDENAWPYVSKLLLASVPAGAAGLLFKDWFEARFAEPAFAATMILVTGCIVWSIRWGRERNRVTALEVLPFALAAAVALIAGTIVPFGVVLASVAVLYALARLSALPDWHPQPTWLGALFMGVAQALAILPGITRSGTTVLAGVWRRVDPVAAAEFSFLMSIIAIAGAGVLQVPDAMAAGEAIGAAPILIGGAAAMAAGIVAIRFFLALLRRQNFHIFAYYCWVAAAAFLLLAQ
jgi:undecaprenyl-diphosphatase